MKVRQWDGGNGFECSKPFMAGWKRSWEDSEAEDHSDYHQAPVSVSYRRRTAGQDSNPHGLCIDEGDFVYPGWDTPELYRHALLEHSGELLPV